MHTRLSLRFLYRGLLPSALLLAPLVLLPASLHAQAAWQNQDVGAVAVAGSSTVTGERVSLSGSGADIWNLADEFHYRFVSLTGDGEIVARVATLGNTHGWAKAGVMFREALTGPSRHAWMCVSAVHGTSFQYRLVTGGESGSTAPTEAGGVPRWVRVVRRGDVFTGSESTDGITWVEAGSITVTMPATLYADVAVTSHNDGVLCTSDFTDLRVTGAAATTPPAAPANLRAGYNPSPGTVVAYLAWEDRSSDEAGFEVERSGDNITFARIGTTTPNQATFGDNSVSASTSYYYRVRAVNSAGASAYTNSYSVTTPAASPPPDPYYNYGWIGRDVGGVAVTGNARTTDLGASVSGSGRDIWNTADEFHYFYKGWTGDGDFTARVTALTYTNGWAKAGLMFRESLDTGSRHAWMCVSAAHGTAFQYRHTANAEMATSAPTEGPGAPRWLRISRRGDVFTGYESADGITWSTAGSITLALPATIFVGMAVTSHNDGEICNATFEQLALAGPSAPPPPPATPPDPPSNLNVSRDNYNSPARLVLTWADNSNNETGFLIERSLDGTAFTQIATTSANATFFMDTSLTPDTIYYYRLRATASGVNSSYSNIGPGSTSPAATRPGAPTEFVVVASSLTTASLSWRNNAVNDSHYATFHSVERSTDNVNFTQIFYIGTTSCHESGLNSSTTYYYRVRSEVNGFFSEFSPTVSMRPGDFTLPPEPASNLAATALGSNRVELTWTDRASNETTFRIERATGAGEFFWLGSATANSTRYLDDRASPSTTYRYRVIARTNDLSAAPSNIATVTTLAVASPTDARVFAQSGTRAQVQWTEYIADETGFSIERSLDGITFAVVGTTAANRLSYDDSGLTANTLYYYRVRAVRNSEFSGYTNVASATTLAVAPGDWISADIGAVSAAGSSSGSSGSYTVSGSGADIWESADEFRYHYQPWTGDGEIVVHLRSITNTHAWAKAGLMFREALTANSRHAFLCISAGNSSAFITRSATGGPSASTTGGWRSGPLWLRLVRHGNTFTGYTSGYNGGWAQLGTVTLDLPSTLYVGVAVTSHNDGVLCSATMENLLTRDSSTLPTPAAAPSNVVATRDTTGAVRISWQDNSANELGFQIYRSNDGRNFYPLHNRGPNATTTLDDDVAAGQTYHYRVYASAENQIVASTNDASITVGSITLGAPSDLTLALVSPSAGQVRLNWNDNSTDATHFRIERRNWSTNTIAVFETQGRVTTFLDSGLSPDVEFSYIVQAMAGSARSSNSNSIFVLIPSAPSNITATASSSTSVYVSWIDHSDTDTAMELQRSTDNITFTVILSAAGYATSRVDFNLTAGTTYYYRVRSVGRNAVSAYSNTATVTTPGAPPPPPPPPSTWTSNDIGTVAAAGTSSGTEPTFSLSGSGADIWDAADEFHFRHRSWTGDGTFIARVTSIGNTHGWAKAGIMLREGLSANSRHVFVGANPGNAAGFFVRSNPGGATDFTLGVYEIAQMWLKLERSGTQFRAYQSANGTDWIQIGGALTVSLPTTLYAGLAVTSHADGTLCSATFQNVAFTGGSTTPPPPPESTWSFADIGSVGLAGSNTSSGNTITVRGSGADIWGLADGFRFVYRSFTGDGVVEARVDSIQNTNGWAKAGVMVRETLAANSRNAFAFVTPTFHGLGAQARTAAGGETTSVTGPARNAPYWIRLRRTGSTFTASSSSDGISWTTYATFTIPMSTTVHFGFAVTSHDNAQLNTATFSDPFVGTR